MSVTHLKLSLVEYEKKNEKEEREKERMKTTEGRLTSKIPGRNQINDKYDEQFNMHNQLPKHSHV